MPSIQDRSKVTLEELIKAAAQLGTRELERFVARVLVLRAQRLAPSLAEKESRLLGAINQGLSTADRERYGELTSKRRAETLNSQEHQELLGLIDRIERADAERVRALTSLAQLRDMPIEALMSDLGIHTPAYG